MSAATTWLPWINLVLIIILIIILIVTAIFTGNSGLVNGVNYDIVELESGSKNVTLKTGTNTMGISSATVDQTVTILGNNLNKKGLTIGIKNNSEDKKVLTIAPGSGVSLDDGEIGLTIEPGETATFIATTNSNSFLRLT